jgi:dimeric dUTPase (all-alpha-NTP-PPase superfamily)
MNKKILEMLRLQQELNDSTNGLGWEKGITKNGKRIDWRRCIYIEAVELIDSYPWKHWKDINALPDYENIKIEIVDIWHFVMSEALRVYLSIEEVDRVIESLDEFERFSARKEDFESLDVYQEIEVVENMIKATICKDNDILELLRAFFMMSYSLNLSLDELYILYIGKNILNQFRQDNGYKSGTYIKNWNGQEDNVVMQNILSQNSDISPKELYQKLRKLYPENN